MHLESVEKPELHTEGSEVFELKAKSILLCCESLSS